MQIYFVIVRFKEVKHIISQTIKKIDYEKSRHIQINIIKKELKLRHCSMIIGFISSQ